MPAADAMQTEERDYYEVLGAEPSASAEQLRAAFRGAVLRHHPDRAPSSDVATRRTSILNRAWAELRDPLRRLHYDHALEGGTAATLDWPLDPGRHAAPRRRARRPRIEEPSPWHQPQWRWVSGFRVPAEVFLAGPARRTDGSSSTTSSARTGAITPSATGCASPRATTAPTGGPRTSSARSSACSSRTRR